MAAPPARGGLPTGAEKTRRVREMFDAIAPRYELVNRCISLGLDAGWRRRTVAALGLRPGAIVLDVAAGTGDLATAARRVGLRPVALDLSLGMLESGAGAPAAQCDAAALPVRDGAADGVVCGFALRNFTDLEGSLREMARAMRPGGRAALLEVGAPAHPLLRAGYSLWFDRVVPLIGAALSDRAAYRYLPASVAYLPEPDEMRALLERVGFDAVEHQLLSGGCSQLYVATRGDAQ